ncbi:hypothetical protein HOA92_03265 [archaeon]|nr:hypothetical protein [archaeon]
MEYIEAPTKYQGNTGTGMKSIFLAGGITNCYDWQSDICDLLQNEEVTLLNPRRKRFPIDDPRESMTQIRWEYDQMRKADAISFWFSKETLNPIVLYELGAHSMTDKPLFVGVDPEYLRKSDVEIQTALARPEIKVVYDLNELAEQVKEWIRD